MKLPFAIDRHARGTLTELVVESVKRAIKVGRLAEGDALPPRDVLARELNVSEYVVRRAIRQLADDGLVTCRPRLGCVVHARNQSGCVANILIVQGGPVGSYSAAVSNQILQQELLNAGYRTSVVTFGGRGTADMRVVKQAFRSKPDFAILRMMRDSLRLTEPIARQSGCKYIVENTLFPADDEAVRVRPALDALAEACCANGVYSVGVVHFGRCSFLDVVPLLESRGICVERIEVGVVSAAGLENIQRASARALARRIGAGPLPDLLFFTDDYLTMGALPVLLERGLRIPEDVRLVTVANKGFGPVFSKSFARIEFDVEAWGEFTARRFLAWLRKGASHSAERAPEPVYLPGETFPSAGSRRP